MRFNYENLDVTEDIKKLISDVYKISSTFPNEEKYGLISQVRRASVSVLLNIAEGSSRKSRKEFIRFLNISIGSLVEVDAVLKLAGYLTIISEESRSAFDALIQTTYYRLFHLRESLKKMNI